jgi:MFS family permease
MCTGISNFFSTLSGAILILYMARTLELSKLQIAVVFVAGPVGSIAAGVVTGRISRRIGVGPTILATIAVSATGVLCYPLATRHAFPMGVLMVGGALFGFGAVAYNITQVSLRQAITPERLQGRMNAAMRWIVWGTIPLGTLLGGAVATWFGLRAALWVGGIGNSFKILPLVLSSVPKLREMPEPVEEPTPAEAELEGGALGPQPLPGPAAADL